MAETPEQIASLLIPMIGRPMLLPNVAVAEIVSWEQPERREGAPDWLLGQVQWRGVAVPVVSLELMNAADVEDAGSGQRLAVVNGVGECQLPFYAISVQGLPRLVRVFPEELVEEEVSSDPAYDTLVLVSGERAVIPDLAQVEQQLNQNL
ncbi:MAG: chemotaxis protein CheW [Pseudomonadota bacterium]|nr:chemotaxis protein CheW [Pseudomonadales bacterium]MDY6921339.1 chemotaxis protein CheW [Pseudomonadota bacterium]